MSSNLHIIDLREKSAADLAFYQKLLSEDERLRMQRFATPLLKNNFALSHGFLRRTLGERLNQDPAQVRFTYNEFGKPFLENQALQFNLAHSGDYCVIAFSEKNLIGVDIEYCTSRHHPLEIAKRFFTPTEYQALQRAKDLIPLFFHIWTQKEAFLKAIGRGLVFGLDQFEVSTNLAESYVKNIKDPEYTHRVWQSQSFDQPKGYRITVTQENLGISNI